MTRQEKKYIHRFTGSIDTKEGWMLSYSQEELEDRELTAEEAFEEDEGETLILISSPWDKAKTIGY